MKRPKILIIDDEEDYCLILKSYFLKKDCEVFFTDTLKEGIQLLQQHQFDILFLDNNLPDGNGWQIVDKILIEMPGITIYFISAYKQKTDLTTISSRVIVCEKPISFELLEEIYHTFNQQKEIM